MQGEKNTFLVCVSRMNLNKITYSSVEPASGLRDFLRAYKQPSKNKEILAIHELITLQMPKIYNGL